MIPCSATTRQGLPCRGPAMAGQCVCRMHGGTGKHAVADRNG
jgi:hypothetical protein